jgi:leucyl aminopeptidase
VRVRGAARLGVPWELHAIVAATENMINGKAYKLGDVLTASNGKTVEIDNTDAEGRLTLADALVYAASCRRRTPSTSRR